MTKTNLNKISEIGLTYSRKVKASDRPKVRCSRDAYNLFRQNWDDLTINLYEEFKVLLLDRDGRCMGIACISKGGVSGTMVDPKLVFATALKARACAIILAHNHPSGNKTPSLSDKRMTQKLIRGAEYLDIAIHDHIIVTDEGYLSFSERKYMHDETPYI